MILDGATCQPREHGDVRDVLSVLVVWKVKVGEEEGSAPGGRRVREQPWMRHGSHQMTTLVLVHKDDNAILEPCASVVRCAL